MKRYLSLVLVLLVMVMPLMGVDAKKKTTTTTAAGKKVNFYVFYSDCILYTYPRQRDRQKSHMTT